VASASSALAVRWRIGRRAGIAVAAVCVASASTSARASGTSAAAAPSTTPRARAGVVGRGIAVVVSATFITALAVIAIQRRAPRGTRRVVTIIRPFAVRRHAIVVSRLVVSRLRVSRPGATLASPAPAPAISRPRLAGGAWGSIVRRVGACLCVLVAAFLAAFLAALLPVLLESIVIARRVTRLGSRCVRR
jgi:hypothetical protein